MDVNAAWGKPRNSNGKPNETSLLAWPSFAELLASVLMICARLYVRKACDEILRIVDSLEEDPELLNLFCHHEYTISFGIPGWSNALH